MNNITSHQLDPDLQVLDKYDANRVGRAIWDFYMLDRPQPSKVIIYKSTMGLTTDKKFQASVRIETNFISFSPKAHKVTIKFRLNKYGNIDLNTLEYV